MANLTGIRPNRTTSWLILGILVACALPFVYALAHTPPGSRYLGFEYNSDDHMVYAAWMRQAMSGQFLFDNRFTTDAQPGLTIHLYFLVLGWLALLVGIPLAATIGRLLFAGIFLWLMSRTIKRLGFESGNEILALVFVALGGGLGFLFWQMFGTTFTKPFAESFTSFLLHQLPVDVWQPEAFVFPSMLTNGLFMVSLCLILLAYESFIAAKECWKPVVAGFLAIGVLMNIHSYDVLTVALVMVGFLAAELCRKQVNLKWIARAVMIGAGAILPALWFVHVLHNDPVFQSRAATETYSPNFRGVFFGYLPLIVLGLIGLYQRAHQDQDLTRKKMRLAGLALFSLLNLVLLGVAGAHTHGYFLDAPGWIAVFLLSVAAVAMSADENPTWNLLLSWALIGTFAIYFPGLFQRKLTMGLSVPWAVLASYGLWTSLTKLEFGARRLCVALATIIVCATSVRWFFRDLSFINSNVANTLRHPVYLDPDLVQVIAYLNGIPGKKVLLALPGTGSPSVDSDGHQVPDSFSTPVLPDTAPIVTGLTGAYTYAGHWSETPDYSKRTGEIYRLFLNRPFQGVREVMDYEQRREFEKRVGATYALLPTQPTGLPLGPPNYLGKIVFSGKLWTLVELGDVAVH